MPADLNANESIAVIVYLRWFNVKFTSETGIDYSELDSVMRKHFLRYDFVLLSRMYIIVLQIIKLKINLLLMVGMLDVLIYHAVIIFVKIYSF